MGGMAIYLPPDSALMTIESTPRIMPGSFRWGFGGYSLGRPRSLNPSNGQGATLPSTVALRLMRLVLLATGLAAGSGWAAQKGMTEVETSALAEIQAQRATGFIAMQPWAQLMGGDRLGVGWMTASAADGVVEWTQSSEPGTNEVWREAWYSEDGLKQANGTSQRAIISGYDPAKPIR